MNTAVWALVHFLVEPVTPTPFYDQVIYFLFSVRSIKRLQLYKLVTLWQLVSKCFLSLQFQSQSERKSGSRFSVRFLMQFDSCLDPVYTSAQWGLFGSSSDSVSLQDYSWSSRKQQPSEGTFTVKTWETQSPWKLHELSQQIRKLH